MCVYHVYLKSFFLTCRPCVGIMAAPPEEMQWFCPKCANKKKDKKHKKRKHRAHWRLLLRGLAVWPRGSLPADSAGAVPFGCPICHWVPLGEESRKPEDERTRPSTLDTSLLEQSGRWPQGGVIEENSSTGVAWGLPASIFLLPVTSINKKTVILPFDFLYSLQGLFMKVLDEKMMCKPPWL